MDDLCRTDGGKVAVTLIGKNDGAGLGNTLDARGNGRGSAVCGLVHITVEVVISEDGATNGGYADSLTQNAHFFQRFSDQFMDDTVRTAGAVVQLGIR